MPTEDLVRSHRRTEPAAQERRRQSAEERERLVLENLPLVHLIARKVNDHLPAAIRKGISLEELVSAGVLGLISAVDHFGKGATSNLKGTLSIESAGRLWTACAAWTGLRAASVSLPKR